MIRLVILFTGLALLAGVNYSIYRKEQLLANGRIVLFELAPVDPRSLMQGDYMALRFAVQNAARVAPELRDGHIIVGVDGRGVGIFRRFDNSAPLAADELRVYYRVRNGELKFGTNAFFFQEGDEPLYRNARYGEARVDSDGQLLLTGLRDDQLRPLGPASPHAVDQDRQ